MNTKIKKEVLIIVLLVIMLIPIVFAIPQTLTLQGKLTDSSDTILSGNYNMTFRIYNAYTGGSTLWTSANQTISVSSDGIYHFILQNINLTFGEQYYLGISVGTDSEMTPRINLTSTPYSFRANVTDNLNSTNNYQIQNLTLGEKITFSLGEIIDNIINGIIRITGDLNVTGTSYFKNASFNDGWTSGGVSIIDGDIYAQTGYFYNITSLNVTRQNLTINENLYVQGRIGIGTSTPTMPLDVRGSEANGFLVVGDGTGSRGTNAIITIDRTTDTATENAHGFQDYTIFKKVGSYNSFDSRITIPDNSGDNYQNRHFVGHQCTQSYDNTDGTLGNSSGSTIGMGCLWSVPGNSAGTTVGKIKHILIDDVNFAGTVTNQYGIYVEEGGLDAGANNFLIYNSENDAILYTAGNIGIGTTTPTHELNVVGSTNITGNLSVDTDTLSINSNTNRVGIGISNPTYKVDIITNTNAIERLVFRNSNTGTSSGAGIASYASSGGSYIVMGATSSNYNALDYFGTGGNDIAYLYSTSTTETAIGTFDSAPLILGTVNTERIRIDTSGKVGINTTTPQNTLNIVGSTNSTTGFIVGANTGITGNYSTSSCWFDINGGIITATNCTAL